MLSSLISRTRRNHGLEHASIHVLSDKFPNRFSAQGNSTHRGFYLNIYGNLTEADVEEAVREAHRRMKKGEHQLAVHPNCGTVLLTTATMATLASQVAFGFEMKRRNSDKMTPAVLLNALPSAVLAATVALIASRPLGLFLQEKYTTEGDLGDMEIANVERISPSPITRIFQYLLGQGNNKNIKAYRIDTVG
jgi:hypothetical protein